MFHCSISNVHTASTSVIYCLAAVYSVSATTCLFGCNCCTLGQNENRFMSYFCNGSFLTMQLDFWEDKTSVLAKTALSCLVCTQQGEKLSWKLSKLYHQSVLPYWLTWNRVTLLSVLKCTLMVKSLFSLIGKVSSSEFSSVVGKEKSLFHNGTQGKP